MGRLAQTLGPTQMLQGQCRRATENMISGQKQFKFEPAVPYSCNAVAAASFAAAKSLGSHYSPHPGRGLTWRSTGPIAAGRHLGYKSLAQIPARRNRPVSLYVRQCKKAPVARQQKMRLSAYIEQPQRGIAANSSSVAPADLPMRNEQRQGIDTSVQRIDNTGCLDSSR